MTYLGFMLLYSLINGLLAGYWPPEQIHISLGLTPDEMVFNWLTWDYPLQTATIVMIGLTPHPSDWKLNQTGSAILFTDCGEQHINRTIHVVKINNLIPSTMYYYQVGDPHNGWSTVYSFKTAPDASTLKDSLPHNFILYGDMGTTNTQAAAPVTEMVVNGDIDIVIHAGDMAYNMYEQNGTTGDQFMRDIQAIAANTPYMVAMGNHEAKYNFSHYTQRFRGQPLPKKPAPQTIWTQSGECPNNWFYSFNFGLVHFISISSEIYFDFPYLLSTQYEWLEADLDAANKNRSQAPWVIAYHHRALYCTGTGGECGSQAAQMRQGVKNGSTYEFSLEELYYKYGVDFVYNGHIHNYERVYDVYHGVTNQKTTDMTATSYFVNGDAGNREGHHAINESNNASWSAYRTTAYSFAHFMVHNSTHVHVQQITADSELPPDQQGKILDDVWLVQNKHGPFQGREELNKPSNDPQKSVTYDPYKLYGIEMKVVPSSDEKQIPYISDNKQDYKRIDGVYF